MYYSHRQKKEFNIVGFIPAIICVAIFALALVLLGYKEAIVAAALFLILYSFFSLWIYFRTKNQSYIAGFLFQLSYGTFLLTHPKLSLFYWQNSKLSELILIVCLAATIWLFYLFFTKKAKWRGREVFELASMAIEPNPDGFTERPHPVGKVEYSRDELIAFAKFLQKNLIAMPHFEDDRIVFVPVKMDNEFNYLFNPYRFRQNRSWIAFDFQGNVTTYISKIDYVDYKEELSFDQLCENLGKLFIEFMRYFRKGEADRIVYKLNELGMGLTS